MSRGPGRIERAIRELFDNSPDLAFVTVELVEHCYPGVTEADIERKHEVSVLRAAHKIVAADPDWMAKRIEGQGRGWVFFNHANVQSYALARLIDDCRPGWQYYRSPARAARMDPWGRVEPWRVLTREKLLALLAPGSRYHDYIQPGDAWFRHVEKHVARRDGDTARAETLEREEKEEFAAWMAASPFRNRFAASGVSGNETFTALGTVFAWFAGKVRDVATKNDPDEQRASLDAIARNLEYVQQAVTGPDPSAALQSILEQIDGFGGEVEALDAAE